MNQGVGRLGKIVSNGLLKDRLVRSRPCPLDISFGNAHRFSRINSVDGQPFAVGFSELRLDIGQIVAIGLEGFADLVRCLLMEPFNPAWIESFVLFHLHDFEIMKDIGLQGVLQAVHLHFKGRFRQRGNRIYAQGNNQETGKCQQRKLAKLDHDKTSIFDRLYEQPSFGIFSNQERTMKNTMYSQCIKNSDKENKSLITSL